MMMKMILYWTCLMMMVMMILLMLVTMMAVPGSDPVLPLLLLCRLSEFPLSAFHPQILIFFMLTSMLSILLRVLSMLLISRSGN
jgi:hypothetical protein